MTQHSEDIPLQGEKARQILVLGKLASQPGRVHFKPVRPGLPQTFAADAAGEPVGENDDEDSGSGERDPKPQWLCLA
jgi:hypothetical protein